MTCCVLGCRDVLLFATLLVTVVTVTETPNDKASQAVAKLKKTEKKAKEAEQVVAAAKVHVEEAKKQMQIKDEMTKKAEEAQKKADAIKDPKAKKKQLAKVKEYENKAKMAQQVMETEMKKVKGGTKKLIAKQKAANKDHKKLNVGSVSCKAKPVHKDLKPCADLAKKAAKQLKKSSVKWAIEADTFHHRNTHRVFEMWGSKEDCLNRCVSTPTCIGVTRYTDIQKTGCWGFKSGRLERGRTKFITYVISDRVEGGCAKKGVHTKVTFRVKRNHKWVKGEELWKMPMGKGMKPCATRAAKTNGSSAVMFYKKWCFCYKGGKPESGHNGYLVIMIMRKTVKQIDYKGPEQAKMSPTRKVR
eukprot:TRINITY_DN5015_c1_g2_i4.p2 TRINITY_DN5015_c1_g2~~TRINITY_DN5015_c1_g2_i4.p2  ORF type:complete len:359 (-),score=97.63 TRINITY_DN5015_c1_g2_i4:42-1118(-)